MYTCEDRFKLTSALAALSMTIASLSGKGNGKNKTIIIFIFDVVAL